LPSLIRFLIMIGGIAGLVYGGLIALSTGVKVHQREMTQIVELPKAPK